MIVDVDSEEERSAHEDRSLAQERSCEVVEY